MSYGSLYGNMQEMYRMASTPGGRGLSNYTQEQVNQYAALKDSLPYMAQLEQMRMQNQYRGEAFEQDLEKQRRGAVNDDYMTRLKYYKQYGI